MPKDKKPYKILVIEDNPGDFAIVEEFLNEQIFDPFIINADTFKEAVKILTDPQMVLTVILLDLSLPDKNGQLLVTEILKLAAARPVIILTGQIDINFSIKSISEGISDYLIKDDLNATTLYKSILYAIERKKSIFQLEESEKRYSNLFHLSPQPMWVLDPETLKFAQVNKAATEHYGYTEEEFLKLTLLNIIPENDKSKAIEIISRNKVEEAGIFQGKIIHHKKSGELIEVEIYSTPIVIEAKQYRLVICIDVTEKNLNEYKITKAIIKTQEDERYEIGEELHDNVCQILATCSITMGMLKDHLASEGLPWFNQSKEYIALASDEIRNLSHRLAPAFFDDTTLEESFSLLLKNFNIDNRYKISLYVDPDIYRLQVNRDIQMNVYRILQEQLRNIFKYAKALAIKVEVFIVNNKLMMSVSDDGIGFNVNAVKEGIGIANMKRRAELFSGRFHIDSSPGQGCRIEVDIPLQ